MRIENLNVARIAIHEVFQRSEDRKPITPHYADTLENWSEDAITEFKARVTEALSAQAKSIEMSIVYDAANSHVAECGNLIRSNAADFLSETRRVADRLTAAQMNRNIPGGVLIVFDGTVGAEDLPYLGVIKAETQSGFRRLSDNKQRVITEFLSNVFLTPATRLYKIAVFVLEDAKKRLPKGWRAFVFDANISPSHRETAAQYFYEGFLGCQLPEDGAYETSRFFELTKEFVRGSGLSHDKKRTLVDALFTFVQAETARTFTSEEFAEKYLPVNLRDTFDEFLEAKKFPSRAIVRDISGMGNKLKRRRFKFGADIEFSASPDALKKSVVLKSGKAKDLGGDGSDIWTQITIKQQMTEER